METDDTKMGLERRKRRLVEHAAPMMGPEDAERLAGLLRPGAAPRLNITGDPDAREDATTAAQRRRAAERGRRARLNDATGQPPRRRARDENSGGRGNPSGDRNRQVTRLLMSPIPIGERVRLR